MYPIKQGDDTIYCIGSEGQSTF